MMTAQDLHGDNGYCGLMEAASNPSRRGAPLLLTTTTHTMDLRQRPPFSVSQAAYLPPIRRFGAAIAGQGEDDDRDLWEARPRPRRRRLRPTQDQQDLPASPVRWALMTGALAQAR